VFGERFVSEEVKLPIPVPLFVFVVSVIVGFGLVDHTTPLEITATPPSVVKLPPVVADVLVMAVIVLVVSVGGETMELISFRQRTENPFCSVCPE
jgi:hypothetical protein